MPHLNNCYSLTGNAWKLFVLKFSRLNAMCYPGLDPGIEKDY